MCINHNIFFHPGVVVARVRMSKVSLRLHMDLPLGQLSNVVNETTVGVSISKDWLWTGVVVASSLHSEKRKQRSCCVVVR